MSPWAWLAIAMGIEAILFLWLAWCAYEWGYLRGARWVKQAWDECREKDQQR